MTTVHRHDQYLIDKHNTGPRLRGKPWKGGFRPCGEGATPNTGIWWASGKGAQRWKERGGAESRKRKTNEGQLKVNFVERDAQDSFVSTTTEPIRLKFHTTFFLDVAHLLGDLTGSPRSRHPNRFD